MGLKTGDVVTAIDSVALTTSNWAETAREKFRLAAANSVVKVTTADGREVPVTLAEYY
jgi:hypothetical protein